MDKQQDSWIKLSKNRSSSPQLLENTLRLDLIYLGTNLLKTKIDNLFKDQLPSGELEIIFRATPRIQSCFRFKDKIPRSLFSGAIYKYKFFRCNSRYIGSTYRYWEKELEDHVILTGKALNGYSHLFLCFKQKKNAVSITVIMIFVSRVKSVGF